jgi:hypothetical protein
MAGSSPFVARDGSRRRNYRYCLAKTRAQSESPAAILADDRPLHPNNTGKFGLRRGERAMTEYWALHVAHWPARVVVNAKDFVHHNTEIYPLVAKCCRPPRQAARRSLPKSCRCASNW